MKAMKTRFAPLYGRLKELVESGIIGEIHHFVTCLKERKTESDIMPLRPLFLCGPMWKIS